MSLFEGRLTLSLLLMRHLSGCTAPLLLQPTHSFARPSLQHSHSSQSRCSIMYGFSQTNFIKINTTTSSVHNGLQRFWALSRCFLDLVRFYFTSTVLGYGQKVNLLRALCVIVPIREAIFLKYGYRISRLPRFSNERRRNGTKHTYNY